MYKIEKYCFSLSEKDVKLLYKYNFIYKYILLIKNFLLSRTNEQKLDGLIYLIATLVYFTCMVIFVIRN